MQKSMVSFAGLLVNTLDVIDIIWSVQISDSGPFMNYTLMSILT